jgi:heparanase
LVSVSPAAMPKIATIDDRFESFNVEMAEVIGGTFWKTYDAATLNSLEASGSVGHAAKPASLAIGQDPAMFQARSPIDLRNPRLQRLASALGPAYVRVSGTWANSVFFSDSDSPPPTTAPPGFQGILTRPQWKGVIDFTRAVNSELVTSFAISPGVRDSAGMWTPIHIFQHTRLKRIRLAGSDVIRTAAELLGRPPMAPVDWNLLHLGPNDEQPPLRGAAIEAGVTALAPASITFLAFATAGNRSCH